MGEISLDGEALTLAGDHRITRCRTRQETPRGAEVLARVHVVGICASDMGLFAGSYGAPHRRPVCFGHEWSGVVEAVGPDVQHLRPGDHVTGECSLWCGNCDRCRHNHNLCRHIEKFGITVDGAARARVVLEERHLHRAVPDLDLSVLALAEPLAVCHQGLLAADFAPGQLRRQRVLILGAGMIGLGCALLLKHMFGCTDVTVCDREPARLARAEPLGVALLEGVPAFMPASDYAGLYGGDGFDLVIETTGAASPLRQGLALLNPGGTLVMLGFLAHADIAPKDLVVRAARMVGSIGGSGSFEAILSWLATHAEVAARLISHSLPVSEAAAAFARAADRQQGLKVQMRLA